MSERGSFTTEYIHCEKCLGVARKLLCKNGKYLRGFQIPGWGDPPAYDLPIIAGKIGGLYSGEELDEFEFKIIPELAKDICHPLRVAVIAESGERIFTVLPPAGEQTTFIP